MGDNHRQLWRDQGIADSLQDWFRLGFVEQRKFYNGSSPFVRQALTIPHFEQGWQAVNVQYRILDPPSGVGKYRYTAGLPAPLFLTEPDEPIAGPTVLVEGAKKAMVVWAHIGSHYKVVAVPSKVPGKRLMKMLVECDPLYVTLDPDAYTDGHSVRRIGQMMNGRCRFVRLPAKPDDLLTLYGMDARALISYIEQATKEL